MLAPTGQARQSFTWWEHAVEPQAYPFFIIGSTDVAWGMLWRSHQPPIRRTWHCTGPKGHEHGPSGARRRLGAMKQLGLPEAKKTPGIEGCTGCHLRKMFCDLWDASKLLLNMAESMAVVRLIYPVLSTKAWACASLSPLASGSRNMYTSSFFHLWPYKGISVNSVSPLGPAFAFPVGQGVHSHGRTPKV